MMGTKSHRFIPTKPLDLLLIGGTLLVSLYIWLWGSSPDGLATFNLMGGISSKGKIEQKNVHRYNQAMKEISLVASPTSLVDLAEAERIGHDILKNCVQKIKESGSGDGAGSGGGGKLEENHRLFLSIVHEYLIDYHEAMRSLDLRWRAILGKNSSEVISQNPIASFLMMDRFLNRLLKIEEFVSTSSGGSGDAICLQYGDHAQNIRKTIGWPTQITVEEAANRVLRIQHVYNFTAQDLAQGKFGKIETGVKMHLRTWFDMGAIALDHLYYTLALEWLNLAENRLKMATFCGAPGDPDVRRLRQSPSKFLAKIKAKKLETIEKHDQTWEVPDHKYLHKGQYHFDTRLDTIDPKNNDQNIGSPTPRRTSWYTSDYRQILGLGWDNVVQYWALCSGDFNQTEAERSKLFCWLETKIHPAYRIAPVKMEFMSRSPAPDIVQVYDLFGSQSLIDRVAEAAAGQYKTPQPENDFDHRTIVNQISNVNHHLPLHNSFESDTISQTISDFTGHNLMGKTHKLAVAQYSPGGHRDFHVDLNGQEKNAEMVSPSSPIAMIMTVIIYLSDVESGGHTVFQGAGMGTRPVKGSAVAWYNYNSDVTVDLGNVHVATKWIPSADQMFHRPCHLKQRQHLRVAANGVY